MARRRTKNTNNLDDKRKKPKITVATLSSNIVENTWLTSVIIENRQVDISNSWSEFIMLLISVIYNTYKEKTIKIISDNGVICDSISIYKEIIIHPECDENQYESYKIANSDIYVEFKKEPLDLSTKTYKFNGQDYSNAIKVLCKILKADAKSIVINTISLDKHSINPNDRYETVERVIYTKNLQELSIQNFPYMQIEELIIFGSSIKISSNDDLAIKFIMWIYNAYREEYDKMDKSKVSTDGIGICTGKELDEKYSKYEYLKIGMLYFYYVSDLLQIIKFIGLVATEIEIPLQLIEIKYSVLMLK